MKTKYCWWCYNFSRTLALFDIDGGVIVSRRFYIEQILPFETFFEIKHFRFQNILSWDSSKTFLMSFTIEPNQVKYHTLTVQNPWLTSFKLEKQRQVYRVRYEQKNTWNKPNDWSFYSFPLYVICHNLGLICSFNLLSCSSSFVFSLSCTNFYYLFVFTNDFVR